MRSERVRAALAGLLVIALAGASWPAGGFAQSQRASRDSWQRVDDVIAALQVEEGDRIADVGAGSGFFTFRLSPRVGPGGRVIAQDISRSALSGLRRAAERRGLRNIETILGETNDPKLPEQSLDGILIVNAYHEMQEYEAMLAGIRRALRPAARLVILDMPADSTLPRRRQMDRHELAMGVAVRDLAAAGFRVVAQDPDFVQAGGHRQWMLVAVVAEPRAGS